MQDFLSIHGFMDSYTDPIDGSVYKTVTIGEQIWMAQNLRAPKYRNGDPIPGIRSQNRWGKEESGALCHYNNDHSNDEIYGKLYNWFAVSDPRGLAPEGWRIPTDQDWMELEIFLGMSRTEASYKGWRGNDEGGKMKETGYQHWHAPNEGATNISGFSALPGGYRDVSGDFYVIGYSGYWWSSTQHEPYFAWYRSIYFTYSRIHRTSGYIGDGYSVRCIMNQ